MSVPVLRTPLANAFDGLLRAAALLAACIAAFMLAGLSLPRACIPGIPAATALYIALSRARAARVARREGVALGEEHRMAALASLSGLSAGAAARLIAPHVCALHRLRLVRMHGALALLTRDAADAPSPRVCALAALPMPAAEAPPAVRIAALHRAAAALGAHALVLAPSAPLPQALCDYISALEGPAARALSPSAMLLVAGLLPAPPKAAKGGNGLRRAFALALHPSRTRMYAACGGALVLLHLTLRAPFALVPGLACFALCVATRIRARSSKEPDPFA